VPKFLILIFLRKKNCKDLGFGHDLTKFTKIPMLKYLKYILKKKKKKDIFEILKGFNENPNELVKLKIK
jgi:hypothetical protein